MLVIQEGHLHHDQGGDIGRGLDLVLFVGLGHAEAAADLEGGFDLGGFGLAQAMFGA